MGDLSSIPVMIVSIVGHPVFSSTCTDTDIHPLRQPTSRPNMTSSDLGDLITQLAHQIGQSIASQIQKPVNARDSQTIHSPSLNMGQSPRIKHDRDEVRVAVEC